MTKYYTVVHNDGYGHEIAQPHVTDIKFDTLPNGDACVRLKNPLGDDATINMYNNSITRVNQGFFNLKGATHAYHAGLSASEATQPSVHDTVDNSRSYFETENEN